MAARCRSLGGEDISGQVIPCPAIQRIGLHQASGLQEAQTTQDDRREDTSRGTQRARIDPDAEQAVDGQGPTNLEVVSAGAMAPDD